LLRLAIDEDQLKDAERSHTTEQVAYLIIDPPLTAESATVTAVADWTWSPDPLLSRDPLLVHRSMVPLRHAPRCGPVEAALPAVNVGESADAVDRFFARWSQLHSSQVAAERANHGSLLEAMEEDGLEIGLSDDFWRDIARSRRR
jgi:hypothetical protein